MSFFALHQPKVFTFVPFNNKFKVMILLLLITFMTIYVMFYSSLSRTKKLSLQQRPSSNKKMSCFAVTLTLKVRHSNLHCTL